MFNVVVEAASRYNTMLTVIIICQSAVSVCVIIFITYLSIINVVHL